MEVRISNVRVPRSTVLRVEQAVRDRERRVRREEKEAVEKNGWLAIGSGLPPNRRDALAKKPR